MPFRERWTFVNRLIFSLLFEMVQAGFVLQVGVPIELHASKLYTAAMYELFRKIIFESGAYVVEVVVPKLKYIARHVQSERRERWSKVSFEVNISGDGDAYNCECGQFDHTGLLCYHALRVSQDLRVLVSVACLLAKTDFFSCFEGDDKLRCSGDP
jgi:hypothetical protein